MIFQLSSVYMDILEGAAVILGRSVTRVNCPIVSAPMLMQRGHDAGLSYSTALHSYQPFVTT